MERLGWQGTFKFQALWSIRDGKGLNDGNEEMAVFKDILRNWTQIEYLVDMELQEKSKRPEG